MRLTKRQQAIAWGLGAGAGLALLIYLVGRRYRQIPELLPTQVSWAGNG